MKRKASGASKAIAFDGKTCHLCCEGDNGPGYDLWHVLFDCPASATINHPAMVGLRRTCQSYVGKLCKLIRSAAEANSSSMSNTENSGVNHRFIQLHSKLSGLRIDMIGTACRADGRCTASSWQCHSQPRSWYLHRDLPLLLFRRSSTRCRAHWAISLM